MIKTLQKHALDITSIKIHDLKKSYEIKPKLMFEIFSLFNFGISVILFTCILILNIMFFNVFLVFILKLKSNNFFIEM